MSLKEEPKFDDSNATSGGQNEKLFQLITNQRNIINDLRRDLKQAVSENGLLKSKLSRLENMEASASQMNSGTESLVAKVESRDQRNNLSPSYLTSTDKNGRLSVSSFVPRSSPLEDRNPNSYDDRPQLLLNTKRLPVHTSSGTYDPRSALSSPVSYERYAALRNEAAKTRWYMKEDLDSAESFSPTSTNNKFSSVQDLWDSSFTDQFFENSSAPKGSKIDSKNSHPSLYVPTPSLAYPDPESKLKSHLINDSPETLASEPLSTLKVPDSEICLTRRLSDSNRTWTIVEPPPSEQIDQQNLLTQPKEPRKSTAKSFLSSFSSLTSFARPKPENRTKSDSVAGHPQSMSTSNSETLYNSKLSFRLDESLVRYLKFDLMKTTLSSSSTVFDNIILHFVVGVTAVPPLASQWKDEVWSYSRSIGQCRAFDASFVLDVGAPPFPTLDWFTNDSSYIQNELLRRSVDTYFRYIFQADLTLEQKVKLIQFLSKDTLREYLNDVFFLPPEHAQKEGILLRYIKNSGLVSRYFYLKDKVLYYAENRNAPVLGTIQLQDALVHRYSANLPIFTVIDPPHQFLTGENYQSAFVIQEKQTEQKNGTDTIHVLLAKNIEDQQSWLRAIVNQIPSISTASTPVDLQIQASDFPGSRRNQTEKQEERINRTDLSQNDDRWSLEEDTMRTGTADNENFEKLKDVGSISDDASLNLDTPPIESSDTADLSSERSETGLSFASTSGNSILETDPRIMKLAQSSSSEKELSRKDNDASIEEDFLNHFKRVNVSGNKMSQQVDQLSDTNSMEEVNNEPSSNTIDDGGIGPESTSLTTSKEVPTKQTEVFGIPLVDAVNLGSQFNESGLPIVIYRCLEYLETVRAEKEEGIYRLSGSSSAIKGLKEQFNKGIDYDLVNSEEMFDVHAVAALLKLYLRELPTNLLDNSLTKIIELMPGIPHTKSSMDELTRILGELPVENFVLLDSLLHHLRRIITFEKYNKMNVRNVGIVFSPTLNIPSEVFNMLIENYELIFTDYIRQANANLVD
ncbi:rho-type GTPase activating protein Rga2 [Schizosaccharomyces octosporus yFS286]|uniref:Rho-type GTPase activating protein Rga2 n=1 Tax=Schizosaccharomyces octosporus (strain yFS286) TaxID=483514 RepID=S9RDK2_SCHOY|nr:rho-type GTPase activating protein Rga2 [Schizosaccharomyces octosporus yFS286]EPX72139.1 rho-type GTPase activating protein Rga2 [Schizosaccharomyces octosporus yFS286]